MSSRAPFCSSSYSCRTAVDPLPRSAEADLGNAQIFAWLALQHYDEIDDRQCILPTYSMSSPRVSARSTDQHNTTERPLPAATSISTHACTAFCRSECLLQTTGSKLKHKDLLATLYAHLSKQAKIWQLRKLRALAVHQCQIVVKNQFFFVCERPLRILYSSLRKQH